MQIPLHPEPNTSAKYRDINGSRIVIQIGGVYTTFCQKEGILWQKYRVEMGGVSRYFSKVSGAGVDMTLLNIHTHTLPALFQRKICTYPEHLTFIGSAGIMLLPSNTTIHLLPPVKMKMAVKQSTFQRLFDLNAVPNQKVMTSSSTVTAMKTPQKQSIFLSAVRVSMSVSSYM